MKIKTFFWIVVLGAGALYAYDRYKLARDEPTTPTGVVVQTAVDTGIEDRSWIKPRDDAPVSDHAAGQFKCDGRTHCSQMRSCAEAEFFLRHCPNTKMDGNRDGEPCEQQWCN